MANSIIPCGQITNHKVKYFPRALHPLLQCILAYTTEVINKMSPAAVLHTNAFPTTPTTTPQLHPQREDSHSQQKFLIVDGPTVCFLVEVLTCLSVNRECGWRSTHLHNGSCTQSYTTIPVSIGTHTYNIHVHVQYQSLLQYIGIHQRCCRVHKILHAVIIQCLVVPCFVRAMHASSQ